MRVLITPGKTGDVLATIAVGDRYYGRWHTHALPGWRRYCERHGLGLVVFDADLIPVDDPTWKKAQWQKLLIGDALARSLPAARNVCCLDTDILIAHAAPNIFDSYRPEAFGLVSFRRNTPYPLEPVLRRMAFLRHTYYTSKYPLDSSLFISLERLYDYHGLPPQDDEACTGVIVFNVANHAELMKDWFAKYDRHVQSITGGGEQTHVNFEIQNHGKVIWLDARFQAMWTLEMAWKYPFLYDRDRYGDPQLIRACIEASLFTNYFLHFAGSWHESDMWTVGRVLESRSAQSTFEAFREYEQTPVSGEPVGVKNSKESATNPTHG